MILSLRRTLLAQIALLLSAVGCHGGDRPVAVGASPARGARHPLAGAEAATAIPSNVAFESLEGPLWVAKGGYLLFSDVVEGNGAAAKIYKYDPGTKTFSVLPYPVTPTTTNGLAVDGDGNLIACERVNGALVKIANGVRQVIADRFPVDGGAPLSAPNDVVVRGDGNIYFTDTVWGARPGTHPAPAVYRVDPKGALSVAFAVNMPNGVALSPDGATLYVGSDAQNRLWRLPVGPAGEVGAATVFVDPSHVPDGAFKVPDGICVDDTGDLYVANNDDAVSAIEVFSPEGAYLGDIALPARPSNCTFGGDDRRTLYVTTLHAIYAARVPRPGLP